METVCRRWSLTADKSFTGLCEMSLKPETSNRILSCNLVLTPQEPVYESVEEELTPTCLIWSRMGGMWNPLCTNHFQPMPGLATCQIPVTPIDNSSSGSES